MKLTKKEKEKIAKQMHVNDRGATWTGIKPAVFVSKKYNTKAARRESARLCRQW